MINDVYFPNFAKPLFQPYRHKVLYGGRGSGKSYAVADALLIKAAQKKSRVLCAREHQNSIGDSVHSLLRQRIEELGLNGDPETRDEKNLFYTVTAGKIFNKIGSEFIFKGVTANVGGIKSIPFITDLWIEEAENISERSWNILEPTVREEGSEIWVTFNPRYPEDPTYQRYIIHPPKDAYIKKVNYSDNPFFPKVLEQLRQHQRKVDYDNYLHTWEGETLKSTAAQIFKNKIHIEEFEPDPNTWDGAYFGVDWGFSQDPTVMVKVWLHGDCLYIEKEACSTRVDLDGLYSFFTAAIPESVDHVIRADNARPETIAYCTRHGFPNMIAADKWANSVKDGIAHLRSYHKIVIHPRCIHAQEQFRKYSYKVDPLTQDPKPDILKMHDHIPDAVRYAIDPMIQLNNTFNIDALLT